MSPYPAHRPSRLRTACAAAVLAAGLFAASPRASAGTVDLSFSNTANNSSAAVTFKIGNSPSASGIPGPYYWHEVSGPTGFPSPTTTFCVELTQSISVGSSYNFTPTPLASTPGVSAAEATAISELYAGHYNTAWNGASFTGSSDSTAFQLALWAIIYDSPSNYNLSTGNLKISTSDSQAITTAQNWLGSLSSQPSFASEFPNEQLIWLSSGSAQDQLTMIPIPPTNPNVPGVPAPPGVLLGLIGVGGCLFGRGFRRRTATATVTAA